MKKRSRGVTESLRKLVANAFPKLDLFTLRQAPSGHLQCSGCGKPYWHLSLDGTTLHVGCTSCGLESSIDLSHMNFDEYLLKGDWKCPKLKEAYPCNSKKWVIQIAQPYLCIGCQNCAYQTVTSLLETPSLYLPH